MFEGITITNLYCSCRNLEPECHFIIHDGDTKRFESYEDLPYEYGWSTVRYFKIGFDVLEVWFDD